MPKKIISWQPQYTYTEYIAKSLMEIEGAKSIIDHVSLPPAIENELRHRTRIRSSHYSTFILHRGGYGINGFFSLEEHHAKDLTSYYESLRVHLHHNYYMGRANADLNKWLGYFLRTLAFVFKEVKKEALLLLKQEIDEPIWLRKLDRRARVVAGLFSKVENITAQDVAAVLGLSDRMARELLKEWVNDGWLVISNPSKKGRLYKLKD